MDVEPRGRLARPVTLAEIKAMAEFAREPARAAGPALRGADHRRAVEGDRGAGAQVSERVVAFSTVGKAEDAERIARALVERRLAACVNVVPGVVSVYRWKGEVCRDEELLLVIKTRAERLPALREALVALHPYELPELVALPIESGHPPYLAWLDEQRVVAAAPPQGDGRLRGTGGSRRGTRARRPSAAPSAS